MKPIIAVAIAALLTGCATRPQDIEAAYVSTEVFAAFSRDQMLTEQDRLVAELRRLSDTQNVTRAIDGAFFFIGGLSTDDVAREIARTKGRLLALGEAAKKAGFDLPAVDPDAVAASPTERPPARAPG